MAFDVNNPYFRTKVLTASPEELRLLLLDGGLHFARIGREGLAKKNYEDVYEGFSQARAIVMELINSMRAEVAPELCANLSSLYTFIYRLLMEASFEKHLGKADEAIKILEYERETWVMLMEQLAKEREGGADPVSEAASPAAGAPRAPLSVQG